MNQEKIEQELDEIGRLHESPIEYQFGCALVFALANSTIRIRAQYQVEHYRYDFALIHPTLEKALMFIECDGKEFHSSVEQLANDRAKERLAETIGAFVVRYSGSAIYYNSKDCAESAVRSLVRGWDWCIAASNRDGVQNGKISRTNVVD